MAFFLALLSLLPYLCLPGTIWLFHLKKRKEGIFQACIAGSLFWSLLLWLETNALSALDLLSGPPIVIFWCLYSLILAVLLFRKRDLMDRPKPGKNWPVFLMGLILILTLVCALAYPPSMWDVLTYHLPRAMHWLQNHNLAPYPTNIARQIGMPPFNSMVALQSMAAGHYDYFVNLGQWLAFAGCIAGAYAITIRLGGAGRSGAFAAVFMATLPAAITQASNAESSLIVTFWLLAFVHTFLDWKEKPAFGRACIMGACLGLAILSKGSAYPVALPFVLLIAFYCLRFPRKRFIQGLAAACLVILINAPHLYRVYEAYGSVVGGTENNILYRPTPGTLAVNAAYNFFVHEPWLLRGDLPKFWADLALGLGVDENDRELFPWGGLANAWKAYTPEDGYGQSPAHALILPLMALAAAAGKFRPPALYSCAVAASFLTYLLLLTWHPWTGRIHSSLFALAAPIFGLFATSLKSGGMRRGLALILCIFAIVPLVASSKPLLLSWDNQRHFLFNRRDALYFNNFGPVYPGYMAAVRRLESENPGTVGLMLYDDGFEYPLWAFLARDMDRLPEIRHVKEADLTQNGPEYIFGQKRGAGDAPIAAPVILKRGKNGYSRIFPAEEARDHDKQ